MFLYYSAVSLPWSSSIHLSQYLFPLAIYMLSSRSSLLPYFLPSLLPSLPPPFNFLPYILHVSETSCHFYHLSFFGLSNVLWDQLIRLAA